MNKEKNTIENEKNDYSQHLNVGYNALLATSQLVIPLAINFIPYVLFYKLQSNPSSLVSGGYIINYLLPQNLNNDKVQGMTDLLKSYITSVPTNVKNFAEGEVVFVSYTIGKFINNLAKGNVEMTPEAFLGCDTLDLLRNKHEFKFGTGLDAYLCEYFSIIKQTNEPSLELAGKDILEVEVKLES